MSHDSSDGTPVKLAKVSIRFLGMWGIWSKTTGELLHRTRAKHLAMTWVRQNGIVDPEIHQITQSDVSGLVGGR